MAKKAATTERIISAATEDRIEEFAEDLGKLLGSAQNKAQNWLGQRKQIVDHLEGIRDTANGLLSQLGHQAAQAVKSGARGYQAATKAEAKVADTVVKQTRDLSAAARKAISDAQKKRWANYRKKAKAASR